MVLRPVKAETMQVSPAVPQRLIYAGDPIGGRITENGERVVYVYEPTIMCDVVFKGVFHATWGNEHYYIFEKKGDRSIIGLTEEQVNQSIKTS